MGDIIHPIDLTESGEDTDKPDPSSAARPSRIDTKRKTFKHTSAIDCDYVPLPKRRKLSPTSKTGSGCIVPESNADIGLQVASTNPLNEISADDDDNDSDENNPESISDYVDLAQVVKSVYPVTSAASKTQLESLQHCLQTIDLTEEEEQETAEALEDDHRFDDLAQPYTVIDLEDYKPQTHTVSLDHYKVGEFNCTSGKTVEFADGSFLRITSIVRNALDEVFLVGRYLKRQNFCGLKHPKRRNELVWIASPEHRILALKDVVIVRHRRLIMTNHKYPGMSTKTHLDSYDDATVDVQLGPLFCRWKVTEHVQRRKIVEERIAYLAAEESDPGYRVAAWVQRDDHRCTKTMLGGSYQETRDIVGVDGLDSSQTTLRQYTFGDAFCGAGGTSCGASQAGVRLQWSFDIDEHATATYRLNFSRANCYLLDVFDFIHRAKARPQYRVDILHLSPPCQPFSPAHTIPSESKDDINQAALFSVGELVDAVKPRVVTIEETEGLVSRHGEWFMALINMFLRIGYAVNWKIVMCGDYGAPQNTRKRLMIIAAGPGDILPHFPRPTHAEAPDAHQKKIPFIGDCIRDLTENDANHDPTAHTREPPLPPFSPNTFAKTVTCNSGVGNYHPSGLRNYTVRELACLQTFPRRFKFADVGVTFLRRQIGNAVPPEVYKSVMTAIIECLSEADAKEIRKRNEIVLIS